MTSSGLQTNTERNIDLLVAKGKRGEGVLASVFSSQLDSVKTKLVQDRALQTTNDHSVKAYTPEELDKAALTQIDGIGEQVKKGLVDAAKGEKTNFNDIAGAASTGMGLVGAFANPLMLATAIPGLFSGSSWLGTHLMAALNYFVPATLPADEKKNPPASYTEALERIQLKNGIAAFAEQFHIDKDKLLADVKAEAPAAPSDPETKPPVSIPALANRAGVHPDIKGQDGQPANYDNKSTPSVPLAANGPVVTAPG